MLLRRPGRAEGCSDVWTEVQSIEHGCPVDAVDTARAAILGSSASRAEDETSHEAGAAALVIAFRP
jgi:hypothetical protein